MTLLPQASVLIVDDDEFMQDIFREMFTSLGAVEIHNATDGRQALRQLSQLPQTPDYLVCDIFMPHMDGFEFLGKLAEMKYPGQVLLVTGVDSGMLKPAVLIAKGKGLHVLGYFNKPMSRDELVIALAAGQRPPGTGAA